MRGKQENIALIKELSQAPGVSGFENEVLLHIRRQADGLGEWSEDSMRNLYLRRFDREESQPRLMIDAHSDEVGFMVRAIRPNGTLDFIPLGGWLATNAAAQRVLVRNNKGDWLPGIIASKTSHQLSETERKPAPEITDLVIDMGASSEREIREDFQISMAAPVVPDVPFEYREDHDIMIGKAFDNRLGCAAIISTFRELAGVELSVNIIGAFTAQEEVGLRGATVSAQTIEPDIAIAFEGTPADDTTTEPHAIQTALKKGPMLRHIDTRMITNPRFQRFALDTACENGIPVQEAVRTGGATDAGVIHLSGKSVPVIVIGIPVRYIHTHHGIAAYPDYENAVRLACAVIRGLSEKVIAGF